MGFRLPEIRPRLPFLGLAVASMLGIAAADFWRVKLLWPCLGMTILAMLLWKRRGSTWLCLLLMGLGFFVLHTIGHHGNAAKLLSEEFGQTPRVVTVRGLVWSEPEKP